MGIWNFVLLWTLLDDTYINLQLPGDDLNCLPWCQMFILFLNSHKSNMLVDNKHIQDSVKNKSFLKIHISPSPLPVIFFIKIKISLNPTVCSLSGFLSYPL